MSSPTDTELPDWALAQAEAALKVGQTMSEIEQSLVTKGLAKETASAVVIAVLEGRIRQRAEFLAKARRNNWVHRVLSAIVLVALVLLMHQFLGGLPRRGGSGVFALVVCIWLIDGKWGYESRSSSTVELPGVFIRWCAWFALALVVFGILLL